MKKTICFTLLLAIAHLPLYAQNTYAEISLPALMKKYQQQPANMLIVDVRTPGEYHDTVSRFKNSNIGRIKGAINIEVRELDRNPAAVKQLEPYKDKEIYLICSHSFRSRVASNILLKNGFAHVSNVQGGMTEWYRRQEELLPYGSLYETTIPYKNISSGQLFDQLVNNKDILLVGINITPRTPWDSATMTTLDYYPVFKKAVNFNYADTLALFELVKKEPGKPVVLFNNYSQGAAETAEWLARKGIANVQYLVGGINYFLEYTANKNQLKTAARVLISPAAMQFITPLYYCNELAGKKTNVLIDLRADTLYNKINEGIKNNYTHLKGSVNFASEKGLDEFVSQFPNTGIIYTLVSRNGADGLKLAQALSKKGYHINWMLGGMQRFDWYSINVETFSCTNDILR